MRKSPTPKEMADALYDNAICSSLTEAIHFLYDSGEIGMVEHRTMLAEYDPPEFRRIYRGHHPMQRG